MAIKWSSVDTNLTKDGWLDESRGYPNFGSTILEGENNNPITLYLDEDWFGTFHFNYIIDDRYNEIRATQSFTIQGVNDDPELTGEKYSFTDSPQGEAIFISQEQLLHGYTDLDDDRLQITELDITKHGGSLSFQTNPDGWLFTPDKNFTGNLDFSYVIQDNNGGFISADNSLNIIERINELPQVTGPVGLGTINEDQSLIFTKTQLLSNASDDQTELIDLSIRDLKVSKGQGTLIENNDETLQNWTFIPTKDWNGEIEFSYNISDGRNINLLDSSFYTKVNGPSWNDAERNANILGGNLVSINSENENNWLIDNFRKDESLLLENGHTTVHIGLESNSGALKWLDNSEVVFNNVHNPQLIGLNHYDDLNKRIPSEPGSSKSS